MNLTTEVNKMAFNNTAEILALSSKWKKNALKLVDNEFVELFRFISLLIRSSQIFQALSQI
jgi:hypothetical protein